MMWIVTESGPPGARQRHWAAGQWNSCVGQRSFTLIRSWGSLEPSICDLKFGHSSNYTQLKATESQSRSCFVPEFTDQITIRSRRGHSFCATAIRGIVFQQSRRILGCRLKLLAAWLLLLRSLTNLTETMNTLFVSCCLLVIIIMCWVRCARLYLLYLFNQHHHCQPSNCICILSQCNWNFTISTVLTWLWTIIANQLNWHFASDNLYWIVCSVIVYCLLSIVTSDLCFVSLIRCCLFE